LHQLLWPSTTPPQPPLSKHWAPGDGEAFQSESSLLIASSSKCSRQTMHSFHLRGLPRVISMLLWCHWDTELRISHNFNSNNDHCHSRSLSPPCPPKLAFNQGPGPQPTMSTTLQILNTVRIHNTYRFCTYLVIVSLRGICRDTQYDHCNSTFKFERL